MGISMAEDRASFVADSANDVIACTSESPARIPALLSHREDCIGELVGKENRSGMVSFVFLFVCFIYFCLLFGIGILPSRFLFRLFRCMDGMESFNFYLFILFIGIGILPSRFLIRLFWCMDGMESLNFYLFILFMFVYFHLLVLEYFLLVFLFDFFLRDPRVQSLCLATLLLSLCANHKPKENRPWTISSYHPSSSHLVLFFFSLSSIFFTFWDDWRERKKYPIQ